MKIAIIGGGIFGLTTFIKLRKAKFDCYLFEKNKNILNGASTNNLNRIHMGYHYPRDYETIRQSKQGSKSFIKMYSNSVIKNFKNYYAISNSSLTSATSYEKALKSCNLKFKKLHINKFETTLKNIKSLYAIKEPIYSWKKIRSEIKKKIKCDQNRIYLNHKIDNIIKKKKYILNCKKKSFNFDFVIDASYEGSNKLSRNIIKPQKKIYQITNVIECKITNFSNIGFALFDGPFFSFLPKGDYKNKNILLYHVRYSVLKKTISKYYNDKWYKRKLLNKIIKKNQKKIQLDIKKYIPELKFKFIKNFISSRVFLTQNKKTDKRISLIKRPKKKYIQIFSGKVDHSVDVANQVLIVLKSITQSKVN
jgi:hypothetical protein